MRPARRLPRIRLVNEVSENRFSCIAVLLGNALCGQCEAHVVQEIQGAGFAGCWAGGYDAVEGFYVRGGGAEEGEGGGDGGSGEGGDAGVEEVGLGGLAFLDFPAGGGEKSHLVFAVTNK